MEITDLLAGAGRDALLQSLPVYLIRQRWFGSKSRAIKSVRISEANALEQVDAALLLVEVSYVAGGAETYQLPLAMASGADADSVRAKVHDAVLATLHTEGGDVVLYDAVHNEGFRAELLRLTAAESLHGQDALASRLSLAEQSNTSILYGDRYILKLYRRVQPGINPDVEIPRFLTSVARFDSIPAYVGHLQDTDGSTLSFLQTFTPNHGDGWKWMMEQLTDFYAAVADRPAVTHVSAPPSFLHDSGSISPEISSLTPASFEAAALLGRRTAELHLALATPTHDPDFAAEAFTPNDLAADSTRIHTQIISALDAMKQHLSQVPPELMDRAASLLSQRKQLLEHAHVLATSSPYRFGRRIRIHGDYHLGQVLRTEDDFVIVDFEGEPARPLDERRRKQSPLKDVAGMMRSFSYVAFAALEQYTQQKPENAVAMESWATAWERAASAAFFAEYRQVIAAHPELLPQPEQAQAILLALLLEKALYELLYELNNRPSWLRIPLGGVLSLLREAA